ncbi:MAG: MFS transporter [Alphaproteobacteria bacterium]|nr:MFS transporter [Alphaproteobacteria bacterium]
MLFLGFSAGLPILLVFSTLSIWLREAGVERATIGFFSWAALAYGFKVVWAPVVDRLPLPLLEGLLGRRRSWMLLAQAGIIAALVLKAFNDPATDLTMAAVFAVLLAFSSATQDIVIDAYRIEAAPREMQGLMSATYIAGYRLGMIAASAGALQIGGFLDPDPDSYQYEPWIATWLVMAGMMLVGVATVLVIREPERNSAAAKYTEWSVTEYARFLGTFAAAVATFALAFSFLGGSLPVFVGLKAVLFAEQSVGLLTGFLIEAVRLVSAIGAAVLVGIVLVRVGVVPREMAHETYVTPFADFFRRFGRAALMVLALVATYRIADVVMGVMANVFYVDLGFEKQEIGLISGGFGLVMTIFGGLAGGLLIMRYGILRMLFVGAVLAAGTNLLFALLAMTGKVLWMLMFAIAADNLSGGIAAAAFVAYLSSLTSARFTATQYALFSSLMLLLPKLIAGYSGVAVDAVGYPAFFVGTAVLGAPVLLLVLFAGRLAPVRNNAED